jgi:hypothetical protein
MRHLAFIGLFVTAVTLCGFETTHAQRAATKFVDRYIADQARSEDSEEYRKARQLLRGDINGDGKIDLVFLYTLEGMGGGNNYAQHLAVLLGSGKTYKHAADEIVGGKLFRNATLKSLARSTINLDIIEYRENDASCCPSRKAKARYTFLNNKLTEVK